METLSTCKVGLPGIAALMMLLTVGCASTRVTFDGPPGTVLFVDDKPYHLPAQVELSRPEEVGRSTRHDVSLVSTVQSQELRAKGHIDVFGYAESDVDKLAVNTCNLDEEQLTRILEGTIVIFRGKSTSRQLLYELTLLRN
jgi:hypothetical protein